MDYPFHPFNEASLTSMICLIVGLIGTITSLTIRYNLSKIYDTDERKLALCLAVVFLTAVAFGTSLIIADQCDWKNWTFEEQAKYYYEGLKSEDEKVVLVRVFKSQALDIREYVAKYKDDLVFNAELSDPSNREKVQLVWTKKTTSPGIDQRLKEIEALEASHRSK